jgi:hypothetical protein
MADAHFDLDRAIGLSVTDGRGRCVEGVETTIYGASKEKADAVSVRFGLLRWRCRLIHTGVIAAADDRAKVIGLRIERSTIGVFL